MHKSQLTSDNCGRLRIFISFLMCYYCVLGPFPYLFHNLTGFLAWRLLSSTYLSYSLLFHFASGCSNIGKLQGILAACRSTFSSPIQPSFGLWLWCRFTCGSVSTIPLPKFKRIPDTLYNSSADSSCVHLIAFCLQYAFCLYLRSRVPGRICLKHIKFALIW